MIYHRADGGPFPDVAIGLTESPGSAGLQQQAAGDLHLSDEARAVDRGVAIPDLVEDFDHEARPRGSSVDVGADESYSP